MRRIGKLFLLCLIATLIFTNHTKAQSFGVSGQLKPNDSVLYNSITMNCPDVKNRLVKIHENDGLARVNAGQQYDSVATKLMARFNSKIAESRLDGGKLFSYAAEFESHLTKFRDQYRRYETGMTQLIKSDCDAYPQNFYYLLDAVRSERQKVQDEVVKLHEIAADYRNEVKKFSKNYNNQKQGESND